MCSCLSKCPFDDCDGNFDNVTCATVNLSHESIDDLVDHFSRMLQHGEFWLLFQIIRSPGDNHCLIHSFVTCLKHLGYGTDDKYILKILVMECTTNSDRYLSHYIGDADEVYIEFEQYVKDKTFDTRFCDLIPTIVSNVLETTVIIVDKSAVGYHLYATTLLHSSHNSPADIINSNFVVLHRNEDHYDVFTLLPVKFQTWRTIDPEFFHGFLDGDHRGEIQSS